MSYAICNVIYGFPLTQTALERMAAIRRIKDDDPTYELLYTGCDDDTGYVGVILGEFDACGEYVKLDANEAYYEDGKDSKKIPFVPTPDQATEVVLKIKKFTKKFGKPVRDACPGLGTYLLFSYS